MVLDDVAASWMQGDGIEAHWRLLLLMAGAVKDEPRGLFVCTYSSEEEEGGKECEEGGDLRQSHSESQSSERVKEMSGQGNWSLK